MNENSNIDINQEESEWVQQYYTHPGFLAWAAQEKLQGITAENVQKYFTLFQHYVMCREKRCHDCSGTIPSWSNESEITSGLLKQTKCTHQEQQQEELAIKQLMKQAPIPAAFKELTVEGLTALTVDVIEEVRNFVKLFPNNAPPGLYLYASVHGVGRTSLMWLIVRGLLERGKLFKGFVFHTTPLFIDKLQTDMFTQEHLFMNKALMCDLLVLDDFGREKATQWSSAKIEAIIEERSWNNRPIILSSVIPPDNWAWQTAKEQSLMSKIRKATKVISLCKDEDKK